MHKGFQFVTMLEFKFYKNMLERRDITFFYEKNSMILVKEQFHLTKQPRFFKRARLQTLFYLVNFVPLNFQLIEKVFSVYWIFSKNYK